MRNSRPRGGKVLRNSAFRGPYVLRIDSGTHHGAAGTPYVYTFDPLQAAQNATWTKAADMSQERWYPSVAELADGSIFVMGGQRYPLMQTFGGQTGSDPSDVSQAFRPYTLGRPGVWKTPLESGTAPSARTDHASCFDRGSVPGVRRLLIHGGTDADGDPLDDLLSLERRSLDLNLGAALDDTAYTWSAASVDTSAEGKPSARRHHTMTLTEWREAYLIGGEGETGTPSQDFIWRLERVLTADSSRWNWKWNRLEIGTEIATGDAPAPRWGHTVVFDPDDGRSLTGKLPKLILYGGTDGETVFDDTWFLRLDAHPLEWEKLESTEAPGGRVHHSAIMDVREANSPSAHSHEEHEELTACSIGNPNRMIVYGGSDGAEPRPEIFVLHRNREGTEEWCWQSVTPQSGPAPVAREQHTAVFDKDWNRMVIHGGAASSDSLLDDVWTLRLFADSPSQNPYVWDQRQVATSPTPPPARKGHTALFEGRYHFAIYPERFYATTTGDPPDVVRTMEGAPQGSLNYPYVFALPRAGEHVFYGGPLGAGVSHRPLIDPKLGGDPATSTWSTQTMANSVVMGSAVQHRAGRIMRSGTTAAGDSRSGIASADTLRYKSPGNVLSDSISSWQGIDDMRRPRANHNLVTMPSGQVVVFGGLWAPRDSSSAVRRPQEWLPGSALWGDTLAEDPAVRNYHSIAVLLPDGRVLSAGVHKSSTVPNPNWERVTIFEPPYLFNGNSYAARPVISRVPQRIRYGQTFSICTPQYATIDSVCLIRPGAVTHSFNMDQRYVQLAFTKAYGGIVATAPADSFIAPPGDYLVFLIDSLGTLRPPSVGKWVRLGEHVLEGATPDTLTDFQADLVSTTQVQATWTSPDLTGELSDGYMVRYSSSLISTENDFALSTPINYTLGCECPGSVQTAAVGNLQPCTWYYFAAKVRSSSNEYSGMARFRVKTLCGGGGGLAAMEAVDEDAPGGSPAVAAAFDREAGPASQVTAGSTAGWELRLEPEDGRRRLIVSRAEPSNEEDGAGVVLEHLTTDGWRRIPNGSSFAGEDIAVMDLRQGWRLTAAAGYTPTQLAEAIGDRNGATWVRTAARHSTHGALEPSAIEVSALGAGDTLTLDYTEGSALEAQAWYCVLDTEQAQAATLGRGPAIDQDPGSAAIRFALHPAQPNPSRGASLVRFDLPEGADVRIEIFDVHGRRVYELARGHFSSGSHAIQWNGRDGKGQRVSPGIYTCRLESERYRAQAKIVVVP